MGFDLPVMNRLRRSGRALSPASLFATGAQGAIYDPRDLSTMFQDSLGTTPVTAPGQSVGLRLDKSGRGNHATQATAGARLTYGIEPKTGTRNALTWSEGFGNAVWGKLDVTVSADAALSPTGSTTADRVSELVTTTVHAINQTLSYVSGQVYSLSAYLKKGGGATAPDWIQLTFGSAAFGSTQYANFNVTNGVVGTVVGGAATIQNVGGGWYRVSFAATATSTASAPSGVIFNNNSNTSGRVPSYAGATTSDILIWGAQLELGSTTTPYQKVVTAFEVTEVGVPTCHYCAYAGANSMATTAIDFTATDKMSVFAGVRKLSDGTRGVLVELSPNTGTNAGSFVFDAPGTSPAAEPYRFISSGTVFATATTSGPYVAPITNVLTGLGDISGDLATLRVNGIQVAQTTGDQGTGNYGNYPLYLGRRGGSTLPFTGRDYGIVIVGKATSAAEINITEAWLAANTPTVVL